MRPHGTVKALRSDNGGEYIGKDFADFCKSAGVLQQFSAPYSPQQNGIAERGMRTLGNMTRCMLEDADLPNTLWAEAMRTATYLKNRTPHATLGGDTPYFRFFGRQANLQHLRVFGSKAFVQYEERARSKLDRKAWEGILVGYADDSKAYRILDPATRKVHESVHVTFREYRPEPAIAVTPVTAPVPSPALQPALPVAPDVSSPMRDFTPPTSPVGAPATPPAGPPVQPVQPAAPVRRSTRQRKHICPDATCPLIPELGYRHEAHPAAETATELGDSNHFALLSAADPALTADPASYFEAMSAPDADQWRDAIKSELDSLVKAETWKAEIIPPGTPLVDSKWVFKRKLGADGSVVRHKARLVARGFTQVPGRDYFDTYAPVARAASIRALIAAAAAHNWELHQMDVDTAYLNAPLDNLIYMRPPKGEPDTDAAGRPIAYRLLKSLYGLKQSARNWNQLMDQWLRDQGFHPSPADPCIYIRANPSGQLSVIVGLYVDDLIPGGPDTVALHQFKAAIARRFDVKDMGELAFLLGMEVVRDRTAGTISLRQTSYVEQVLERFNMSDCKPVATPCHEVLPDLDPTISPNLSDDRSTKPPDTAETSATSPPALGKPDKEYQALVGALLYAAMCTRPDIAFAVQQLSRHLQSTTAVHWVAGKRVLRYLQGTKALGITYRSDPESPALTGYSDSDWGGGLPTRRSTTGYVFQFAGGPISWSSRLQPTVALSSTEAEYMAVSAASQEAVWLRQLFDSMHLHITGPLTIYADNQGCMALAINPVYHARTKHIAIKYHFTRELVAAGTIKLEYIPTADNIADLFTKPLTPQLVQRHTYQVLGIVERI